MPDAAAGLAYLFGDASIPAPSLNLRVKSETTTTITLEWDRPPGPNLVGYRFSREGYLKPSGSLKYSHTFDPTITTVKFAKGSEWYEVEALAVIDGDVYSPTANLRSARVATARLHIVKGR